MAKTQILQTLYAFYHLWGVIEVFKRRQTEIIENKINKLHFGTKQTCERRMQNIGLIPESLAVA